MEFNVGFPLRTRGQDSIFMVVDTLVKSAHFIPICMTYQALDIARFFVSEIRRLQRVPRHRIKEVQDKKKSYVDAHLIDHNYEVGKKKFLR